LIELCGSESNNASSSDPETKREHLHYIYDTIPSSHYRLIDMVITRSEYYEENFKR